MLDGSKGFQPGPPFQCRMMHQLARFLDGRFAWFWGGLGQELFVKGVGFLIIRKRPQPGIGEEISERSYLA